MAVDDFVTDSRNRTICENILEKTHLWDNHKSSINSLTSAKLEETSQALTFLDDANLVTPESVKSTLSAKNLQQTNQLLGIAHDKGLLHGENAKNNLDTIFKHPEPEALAENIYLMDNVSQAQFDALTSTSKNITAPPMSNTSDYRAKLENMRHDPPKSPDIAPDGVEDTTPRGP